MKSVTMFQFLVFRLLLIGATLLTSTIPPTLGQKMGKIDPELQKKIDAAPVGSTWDILVLFKEDPSLLPSPPYTDLNTEESHDSAYNTMLKLKKYADESQASVISEIKSFYAARSSSGMKNVELEQFWCSVGIRVAPASKDLIDLLGDGRKPGNENITGIMENVKLSLYPVVQNEGVVEIKNDDDEEDYLFNKTVNIRKINTHAWWSEDYNGTGVIIGHVDSGVDIHHPSLKYNWVGQVDGWHSRDDPTRKFPYETDTTNSHGTSTIGVAIGRGNYSKPINAADNDTITYFGVGVAPGARWSSCMPCHDSKKHYACHTYAAIKCLEFFYCPNPKNRCIYRPNVITISMGCPYGPTRFCGFGFLLSMFYLPCIRALRSHGVILVYSAGNQGSEGCETISSPAGYEEIIAVGAAGLYDEVTEYSSMGPPTLEYDQTYIDSSGIFKPDFLAPGDNIISTIHTGPEGKFKFGHKSGTSMAAPHVAGAIALLLSRSANLTFENITKILRYSAVKLPDLSYRRVGVPCGGINNSVEPNHKLGHGRLFLPNHFSPILRDFPALAPTRRMPPPPDFTGLAEDSTPPSVRPGMVGVVIMAAAVFLMNAAMKI